MKLSCATCDVVEKNHGVAWKGHEIDSTLKISVKSGKDSTSTVSLVIHRVRLQKNLQKSTLAFKGGGETQKTIKISSMHGAPQIFHNIQHPQDATNSCSNINRSHGFYATGTLVVCLHLTTRAQMLLCANK